MKLELQTGKDNPILRKKAKKVDFNDPGFDINELITAMEVVMEKEDGAGLAASQVARCVAIALINVEGGPEVIINPEISYFSKEKKLMEEGCLSLPGEKFEIERSKKIHLKYCDVEGKKQKIKAKGLLAEVIQHEVDHLNGKLICD